MRVSVSAGARERPGRQGSAVAGLLQRCGDHPCPPQGCSPAARHAEAEAEDGASPGSVTRALRGPAGSLDPAVRRTMERRFHADFSQVQVHSGSDAAASARDVAARAYTVGEHVVFGPGEYDPGRPEGLRLLAHELTHVVQRRGGDAGAVHRSALPRPLIHVAPAGGPAVLRAVEAHVNLAVPQKVRIYEDDAHHEYETSAGEGNKTSRYIGMPLRIIGQRANPTAKIGKWGLQYFSWFTAGGVGFHSNICYPRSTGRKKTELVVDGNPHSHGCARLHEPDAIEVYDALSKGDRVFIYQRRAGFAAASWAGQAKKKTPARGRGGRATPERTHTVRHGETLSKIARRYGVHVEDIADANDITETDEIRAGQMLIIPRTGEGEFSEPDEK